MEIRRRFLVQSPFWRLLLLLGSGIATCSVNAADWQSESTTGAINAAANDNNNPGRGWKITPTIAINATATDNVGLTQTKRQSDLITDINPGLRIEGTGGRSKLSLDYQLHNLVYAQGGAGSNQQRTQNSLNAQGALELWENHFFLEGSGMISQQSISAFGGAGSSSTNTGANTTEVSNYRLSPYFKGSIGNIADYQLRYNATTTHTGSSAAYDSDTNQLLGTVKGVTKWSSLGWSLSADSQHIKFGNGRSNESAQLRGMLTYNIDPQFRVNLIAGRETNDYLTVDKQSHSIKGAGFEWAPTERTQIAATRESRYFGNSNNFSFSHRTEGSAWRYVESKDAQVLPTQQLAYGLGTIYDLYFSMMSSAIPDPIARSAFVNALLLSNGIPPNAQLQGGFLTSGVTLQQRRELSFVLSGARNNVTFTATQTRSENLSQGAGLGVLAGEDFSNVQVVRQRGGSVMWSSRVTENSTLNSTYSILKSKGTGLATLETDQKMLLVNFLTKLGPKTNAGLGARRVIVDGTTRYTENALTASVSHQF